MPNNLYGIIIDGKLETSSGQLEGYKPVVYGAIPDFDQETQYVVQSEPINRGDDIYLGVEIKTMVPDDNPEGMGMQ
jgi:hypothetical protein